MFRRFHPSGGRFKGFSPDGTNPAQGDPAVTDMIQKIREEFDTDKRKDIAKQSQQYMAQKMYVVPFPRQAAPFTLSWPCLGNARVYNAGGEGYGAGTETVPFLWLDTTRAPIPGDPAHRPLSARGEGEESQLSRANLPSPGFTSFLR